MSANTSTAEATTKCHNLYLASKNSTIYDSLKASLRENIEKKNTTKISNTLEALSFYKGEKELLDLFLNLLGTSEDRKVLRLTHYFLTELSQFKYTNSSDAKAISTTFTKEITHKDLSRRVSALKNLVLLAPSDSLTNANILETISSIIRKGEEGDKEKKKRGFFSRGPDLGRERALLQYACLCAIRHRFHRPQSLFMPVLEAIRCNDSVGARHAVALTLEYTTETPAAVATNVRRFLPHLRGKEAVHLTDMFARVYFTTLCAVIGLRSEESSADFFQSLVQSLLDVQPRVVFEAVTALARYPWLKLEKSLVLNIPQEASETSQLWDAIANPVPVLQAITSRLAAPLAASVSPLVHAACRVTRILAAAYSDHLVSQDQPIDQQQLSNPTPTTKFPSLDLRENIVAHPLASLAPPLLPLLTASTVYVRAQALMALVWLALPTEADTANLRAVFAEQLPASNLPAHLLVDVFSEIHGRVQTMPRLARVSLDIVFDWFDLAPDKVDLSLVFKIWKTVVRFGPKGRAYVLMNIYKILDRDIQPQHRVINLGLRKGILWFVGENANLLTDEFPERYVNNTGMGTAGDIGNGALKAIVMRLSSGAFFDAWETRSVCLEGLGKIAIRSGTAAKVHVYSIAALLVKEVSSCVAAAASSLLSILDQQLEARSKWLPIIKSTRPEAVSDEQLNALYADHDRLYQQCEVFCFLPRGFCPIGAESKPFLKVYWDHAVRDKKETGDDMMW